MLTHLKKINEKEYRLSGIKLLCSYIFIFLIGAIIGFIYEEVLCLLFDHELVKRGFLYGPYLPVYGFGAVFIVYFLKKYKKNPIIIFLTTMLVTGLLEYLTGFLLFRIYGRTWWDYTGLFLNINGYVCLRSVLTFAIGGLLLIYIIEPFVCMFSNRISIKKYSAFSFGIVLMFLVDFAFTLMFRNKL